MFAAENDDLSLFSHLLLLSEGRQPVPLAAAEYSVCTPSRPAQSITISAAPKDCFYVCSPKWFTEHLSIDPPDPSRTRCR
jgi:hypothetical protein